MYGLNWEGDEVTEASSRFKVGDRIKVVVDKWGKTFPVGAFGTIESVLGHGITAAREGGDGFGWFFRFNQVEPAPAPAEQVQGRYRVGDRVRVVKDDKNGGSNHCEDAGSVHDLIAVDVYLQGRGDAVEARMAYFFPEELAPAFRPGDRVKLNQHSGIRACGERGTVTLVRNSAVGVNMDEKSLLGTLLEWLPVDVLDWEREREPVQASAADCAECKEQQDNEPASEPKPKFKAGDRVVYKDGTSTEPKTIVGLYKPWAGDEIAYRYDTGGWDFETSLVLAAPCPQDNEQQKLKFKVGDKVFHESGSGPYTVDDVSEAGALRFVNFVELGHLPSKYYSHTRGRSDGPAIVALTKNNQPLPSHRPHVHASVADATQEAERLARINPGQEFAVYQRITARVAEVQMKEVA